MSDAKLPQRYDLVGEYDTYMSPVEEGDYVRVEDVQPLLAEIERLRALNAKLEKVREAAEAWRADMDLPVDHLRTCRIHIRMLSALLGMKA